MVCRSDTLHVCRTDTHEVCRYDTQHIGECVTTARLMRVALTRICGSISGQADTPMCVSTTRFKFSVYKDP